MHALITCRFERHDFPIFAEADLPLSLTDRKNAERLGCRTTATDPLLLYISHIILLIDLCTSSFRGFDFVHTMMRCVR